MSDVYFIVDEAASLGSLECINDAIDKYRGYGIHLELFYQSLGQLKTCFPKDAGQTLLSNVTQVFFGVNDPETAEFVSKRLGDHTIVVESGGRGRGDSMQTSEGKSHSSYGRSRNVNENWSLVGRRLLKPEEVMTLDERVAICFVQGVPPIWTRLERYFEKRIRPPRFQGIKTVLGTMLLFGVGTILAAGAALCLRSVMR